MGLAGMGRALDYPQRAREKALPPRGALSSSGGVPTATRDGAAQCGAWLFFRFFFWL